MCHQLVYVPSKMFMSALMESEGKKAVGVYGLTATVLYDTLDRMGSILHDNDIPDTLSPSQLFVAIVGKFAVNGIDLAKSGFV